MLTLPERLTYALGEKHTQADLAAECRISRAAVSKWFSKRTTSIQAVHVFTVARFCGVDAEWLATGKGKPQRGLAQTRADAAEIPDHRLDLIRRYGTLPNEVRYLIRSLIEVLSAASSDRYATWSKSIDDFNQVRDAKPVPTKAKKSSTE